MSMPSPTSIPPSSTPPHPPPRFAFPFSPQFPKCTSPSNRSIVRLRVSSPTNKAPTPTSPVSKSAEEVVFFDGGSHYGDLVANLLLGFTLFWLPLTFAAVSRAFFLRFRFTNFRVTVISGFTGQDRSDFPYDLVEDVKAVPRFVGAWGDIVITLKDGTKVDLRSVPRFREIAEYCLSMAAEQSEAPPKESRPKGFSGPP